MDYEVIKIEKYFLSNKDPKDLQKNINEMTNEDLTEIFKKSYVPLIKNKEQIKEEIKYKKTWKNPGKGYKEFSPVNPLKPNVLSYWDQERVNMPERTYQRYPISKAIKNFRPGREFGYDAEAKGTSEQYQKYLTKHKEKFRDYVDRPSKYKMDQKFLPSILLDKPPFYIKHSEFATFNFPKHNTFLYENKFRSKL